MKKDFNQLSSEEKRALIVAFLGLLFIVVSFFENITNTATVMIAFVVASGYDLVCYVKTPSNKGKWFCKANRKNNSFENISLGKDKMQQEEKIE